MASGNLLCSFTPQQNEPPSTAFATFDTRNGYLVLDFDDTTDESAIFRGVMPDTYAGGGLVVKVLWSATSATTGSISLNVSFMSVTDDADDLDVKTFAAANNVNPTTANVSGEVDYASITFTDGADMDNVAAGEMFFIKITRDANGTTATDDLSGDMELHQVLIYEA